MMTTLTSSAAPLGAPNALSDASALSSLKQKAVKDPKSAAKEAAQKFEALILQEVMKTGRTPSLEAGLFSSDASKTFMQQMDKQLSEVAARKGTGLGAYIEKAMLKNAPSSPAATGESASAASAAASAGQQGMSLQAGQMAQTLQKVSIP